MKLNLTLRSRLIISFFLLTLTLCGAFAISIFLIIHGLESDLFYRHLDQDAEWFIQSAKKGSSTDLPPGIQLYIEKDGQPSNVPNFLNNLTSDHTEVILGNEAYHVVVRREGDTQYYLVQDQSQFESMEQTIGVAIFIGFVMALAGSIWLGYVTANKIIAPVIELSELVKKNHISQDNIEDIAKYFPHDEVGLLASTFYQYTLKLKDFLGREKLFTGDVSHELRTPLMVISSSCELLLTNSNMAGKEHDAILRIHRASKEMASLVDTFLILSRENIDLPTLFSNFQVDQIIKEEVEEITEATNSKDVKVNIIANRTLHISGVPSLFRVIIKNLLRNANHHTKQGSITVVINPESIYVEDTGRGIPSELKNSIFERHFRVLSPQNKEKGDGLGLSIVRRICDYHHWQIQLETVEPHGSRFIVSFSSPEE